MKILPELQLMPEILFVHSGRNNSAIQIHSNIYTQISAGRLAIEMNLVLVFIVDTLPWNGVNDFSVDLSELNGF